MAIVYALKLGFGSSSFENGESDGNVYMFLCVVQGSQGEQLLEPPMLADTKVPTDQVALNPSGFPAGTRY